MPGLERTYGVSRGDAYEPAERGLAPETRWSSERYLESVPPLFERLRNEFGTERAPAARRPSPAHADRSRPAWARRSSRIGLFWLEDPTPAENQERFRLIRQHTTTPLAVGEVFNSIHDCRQLIQEQLIDYIRTTVVHAGGHQPSAKDREPRGAVSGPHRARTAPRI